eukprot:482922-Pelagomonas_calceolata.AAC.4
MPTTNLLVASSFSQCGPQAIPDPLMPLLYPRLDCPQGLLYGPYVQHQAVLAPLPKDKTPESITLEEVSSQQRKGAVIAYDAMQFWPSSLPCATDDSGNVNEKPDNLANQAHCGKLALGDLERDPAATVKDMLYE